MIALRWAAFVIATVCLIVLAYIPRDLGAALVAALFFLCFITLCWTFGAFTPTSSTPERHHHE